MSYQFQNVTTPRFYINALEWLASLDIITLPSDHFRTLPVAPTLFTNLSSYGWGDELGEQVFSKNCFFAFLGHTRASDSGGGIDLYMDPGGSFISYSDDIQINIGATNSSQGISTPQYDGFSIGSLEQTHLTLMVLYAYGNVGSIILGTYYDMKTAPNLSLTMSREYGGTNEFTTYNGSSMSNTMWNKPPKWGNLGAWELGDGNPSLAKSGRRSWDMKFSFIDDGDLWGSNQMLSTNTLINEISDITFDPITDLQGNGNFTYNLLTDDNFFSQVWHKTLGGTLPFIFQPDKDNNNPDQFAIAKFKNNSLKATQSAFNVYDISISIEEVW